MSHWCLGCSNAGQLTRAVDENEENQVTGVMVTHDVDEAVLLLTDCDAHEWARIKDWSDSGSGHPRPRKRMQVVEHPSYYSLRSEIIYQSAETHQETGKKTAHCRSVIWKSQPRNWLCAADGLCASQLKKRLLRQAWSDEVTWCAKLAGAASPMAAGRQMPPKCHLACRCG